MRWRTRAGALLAMCFTAAIAAQALAGHDSNPIPFDTSGWKTNFRKHSVHLGEIRSGGPPRDGIPAIDRPAFETAARAAAWLKPAEPVIALEVNGDVRAYPLQVLIWHEIVNDVVGGAPVVVTYCPLCNAAVVFDRRVGERVLDFGTTGKIRFSDLVMYDRQTESWWQQMTAEAIVGDLTGAKLTVLPAQIVAWSAFREQAPRGRVLSRPAGSKRPYGRNPYEGYDAIGNAPVFYVGPRDKRLTAMERVVAVAHNGDVVAYPYTELNKVRVAHDTVGGRPIAIFYERGAVSPLHRAEVAAGRDVGAAGVFSPVLEGRRLQFRAERDRIVDRETGSTWSVLGVATNGPLKGRRLEPVLHGNYFWFAWVVFRPETRIWSAGDGN